MGRFPAARPDGLRGLDPVHFGHGNVHQDHVESRAAGHRHAFAAVMRLFDLMPVAFEHFARDQPIDRVVLDQQDAPGRGLVGRGGRRQGDMRRIGTGRVMIGRLPFGQGHRQAQPEGAALTGRAVRADLGAQRLGHARGNAQTQPGAVVVARIGAVERHEILEDARQVFRLDADTVVDHADLDRVEPVRTGRLDRDQPVAGELDRVAQKVDQDLPDARRVGVDALERRIGGVQHDHVAVVARGLAVGIGQLFQKRVQIEDPRRHGHAARIEAGDVEHVVHMAQQHIARRADGLDVTLGLLVESERLQQIERAQHPVERRAHLVAHHRQHVGLGLLARDGAVARGFELVLGGDPVRDVADIAHEDLALGALHIGHGQFDRKQRAVLARGLELHDALIDHPLLAVFEKTRHARIMLLAQMVGHDQVRHVLAHRLGAGIAEDRLGRAVIFDHPPAAVDHDDRVDGGADDRLDPVADLAAVARVLFGGAGQPGHDEDHQQQEANECRGDQGHIAQRVGHAAAVAIAEGGEAFDAQKRHAAHDRAQRLDLGADLRKHGAQFVIGAVDRGHRAIEEVMQLPQARGCLGIAAQRGKDRPFHKRRHAAVENVEAAPQGRQRGLGFQDRKRRRLVERGQFHLALRQGPLDIVRRRGRQLIELPQHIAGQEQPDPTKNNDDEAEQASSETEETGQRHDMRPFLNGSGGSAQDPSETPMRSSCQMLRE